jgi:hypothetical protein
MLADFLNVRDDEWSPKQQRVLEVLRQWLELREILPGMRSYQHSKDRKYEYIEFYDLNEHPRARVLKESLIQLLSRYAIPPTVGLPFKYPGSEPQLGIGWAAIRLVPYGKGQRGYIEESYAIELLLKLAEQGAIKRLRHCLCGHWFWARNAKKNSCSPTCRHNKYEKTDRFKTRRNARLKATRDHKIDRKLYLVRKAISQWASRKPRPAKSWKVWVKRAVPDVTFNWLTLAVKEYGLRPPQKERRAYQTTFRQSRKSS